MSGVLRSVYVDYETEEHLNRLAFFLKCSKNELMEWAVTYALPVINELAAKAKDPEKFVEQFNKGQINTELSRKLKAAKKRDMRRLENALEESNGGD